MNSSRLIFYFQLGKIEPFKSGRILKSPIHNGTQTSLIPRNIYIHRYSVGCKFLSI